MPLDKPAKRPRNVWDPRIMKKALKAVVENEMTFLDAAIQYNVPRTALYNFAKQIRQGEEITLTPRKLGRRPALTEKLEEALAEYAVELRKNDFSLTGIDLREMAHHIALKYDIQSSFIKDRIPGKKWLKDFLRRNPKVVCDDEETPVSQSERELLELTENLTCEKLIDEFGVEPSSDDDD